MTQATRSSVVGNDCLRTFLPADNMDGRLGEVVGHYAHDIRNLLTIVSGCSEMAQAPHLSSDRKSCYLEAVQDGAARAAALSSNMLSFIRDEEPAIEYFDVTERVRSLGRLIQMLVGTRIALVLELPARTCFIEASPAQFDAAVINLATNARDAIASTGRLRICVEDRHSYVEVQIEDNGAGISGVDAKRIFEPFYTTKSGRGTGLGLAQVARFVRSVAGEIGVRTCAGRGTSISLYLPHSGPPQLSGTEIFEDGEIIEGEILKVVVDG